MENMPDEVMVVLAPEDRSQSPDLSEFREANEKKITWDQRLPLIKKQFPSVARQDWYQIFSEDSSILGRLLNDILKIDQAEPGKPGKRPAVEVSVAEARLRQLRGEDYTSLPFRESFRALAANRSIRGLASKTGLDRNLVHRLLQGDVDPTADVMERVAKAFKKSPGYFPEYRIAYIVGVLFYKLDSGPEASVSFFQKLQNLGGRR